MQNILCISGITVIMCTQSKQLESKIETAASCITYNDHGMLSSCADTRLNTVLKGGCICFVLHICHTPLLEDLYPEVR